MSSDNSIRWWDPQIGDLEKKLVLEVLDRNFPNEGRVAKKFEQEVADLVGSKHAITTTSGTSALYLGLKAIGVGPGDEVIVPDLTFIATANAVDMCAASPVLADVDSDTMNLGVDAVKEAITEKTKAIIPVHVSGRPAPIDEIVELAKEYGLYVVEDAAEAFMSKFKGKYLGTYGVMGCFSFSPNKIVTSGQGGLIVTDDDEINELLRPLKDQGRPKRGTGGDDSHDSIGYNFKFTDIQAAVALGQLTYLEDRMKRLVRNHRIYVENLSQLEDLRLYGFDVDCGVLPLWTDVYSKKRDELDLFLQKHDVDCRRLWHPLHRQKAYKMPDSRFPSSLDVSSHSMWLPSAYTLNDGEVLKVCDLVLEFLNR